jgi:hypothetical protein
MYVAVKCCMTSLGVNAEITGKSVVLLHDSAHPHFVTHAVMLSHIRTSPHGHNHAQSGIHLFGPFKDALEGYYFEK